MKDQIIEYLKRNVIGVQLRTDEIVYSLEDGKLEDSYSDQMVFSNLILSDEGFQFDMTTVTEEKIYFIKDGKRSGLKKDFTGTSVFRYELSYRHSTNQFTGYMRCLSSSVQKQTMHAVVMGVYDVVLTDNKLKWKEIQLLYRDMPSDDNVYRSVAFDANVRFFKDIDKLRFEYVPLYYEVNPVTLGKTLIKEQLPSFISKEK